MELIPAAVKCSCEKDTEIKELIVLFLVINHVPQDSTHASKGLEGLGPCLALVCNYLQVTDSRMEHRGTLH